MLTVSYTSVSQNLTIHRQHKCYSCNNTLFFSCISKKSQQIKNKADSDDGGQRNEPWVLSWQINERNTEWTEENQRRLMKILSENELELSREQFEQRITQLIKVVPGIEHKIFRLKHKLLTELLGDVEKVANTMLGLKELMPNVDASKLVCGYPQLLLQSLDDSQKMWQYIKDWHAPRYKITVWQEIEELVEQCPWLLDASVQTEATGQVDEAFQMAKMSNMQGGQSVSKIVRTDTQVGDSDAWDTQTQSYRD
eukprot:TRINITY_DN12010_c1_g1_i4.p2 TRINITY_DN12010_c1_g1~~TRINITY_DN12010_c1_g1_i4.p2  ORF type:complete len:253 (+),score=30.98 TRINITY_DN12010_c1_g1_i4:266-1024(+)